MADALQGTWVINEKWELPTDYLYAELLFNSDDINYYDFSISLEDCAIYYGDENHEASDPISVNLDSVYDYIYNGGNVSYSEWVNSFGTITITSTLAEVTNGDTLLAWLQANATKQADPSPTYPKINSFTYHGKQIRNINGKPIRYVHDNRAGMDDTYEMVYVLQLAAPIATASGTIVSWGAVENATSYEILVDGSSFGTVSTTSVDLSTLSGWASLTDGEYSVTIVARADGYRDSEQSAAVSVQKAAEEYTDCITFTGESSDFTLAVGSEEPKEWDGTVEYSTDHNTWTVWDGSEISSSSKKLYLRGSGNTTFYMLDGAHFVLSARAACSGNIQTLLEYSNPPTTILEHYCYSSMFLGCTGLTQAPELPATTLADNCYESMFYDCTSLTQAPELPATTLADECYMGMFAGCTSLTQAPELPATTLVDYCYYFMFSDCTNLTAAPELPATALANNCYQYMFRNCTSLTRAPELPVTTLTEGCYSNMFCGCTSLTTAPVLPATTLAMYCYTNMFYGCTSLTRAPELPATALAHSCYYNMFNGCTSLRISSTRTSEYSTAWRIPSSGTISSTAIDWNYNMLSGTGGTFKSDPSINTTYYGAWTK